MSVNICIYVIEVFISWQSMGFLASITIGSSCSLTITCCRDKRLCRGPPRNVTSTAHQKESGIVGHCNHLAGNVSFDGTAFSFLSFVFFSESRRVSLSSILCNIQKVQVILGKSSWARQEVPSLAA